MIETVVIFAVLILVAMLIEPLATKIKLPFSSVLVVLGFVGSEFIVFLGFDTGFRWHHFVEIILHLLVPIIVFESAFNANTKALRENISTILFLAIPAMLIASGITGFIIYLGINDSVNFPLITAMLAGVILSATDPVAVVAIFKKLGAPDKLTALLEGESLFNDAAAIVAFTILVSIALEPETAVSITGSIMLFFKSIFGGIITGVVIALLAVQLYKFCKATFAPAILGLVSAIIALFIAEHLLHASGVVAILVVGLYLGSRCREQNSDEAFAEKFWEFCAYIANAILFILVGVTITVSMFTGQWLAMLIGIIAAIIARVVVVYGLLPVYTLLPKHEKTDANYKKVMLWGGLRGAVSLALALSLPTEVEAWYTVQSIVYGVVLFTLFVQAPFMDKLVAKTLKSCA